MFASKAFQYDGDPETRPVQPPSWASEQARFRLRLDISTDGVVGTVPRKLHVYPMNVIGSSSVHANCLIQHPSVSPVHTIIVQHETENDTTCVLFDMKSRTGTFVGTVRFGVFVGKRIKPYQPIPLREKTAFKLGNCPNVFIAKGVHVPILGTEIDRGTPSGAAKQFRIGPTKGRVGPSVWAARHMHSWHLRGLSVSKSTLGQYNRVYRVDKHPEYENLMRGLEVVSGFTFSVDKVVGVIDALRKDLITRTAAKRELLSMVDIAMRAGNRARVIHVEENDSPVAGATNNEVVEVESRLKLPTLSALRRYKLYSKVASMDEVRRGLESTISELVSREWKPAEIDASAIGVQSKWNTIHGDPHLKLERTVKCSSSTENLPLSYLLRDRDPDLLTSDFIEAMRPPKNSCKLILTKVAVKNGGYRRTLGDQNSGLESLDLSKSIGLSSNLHCRNIFSLITSSFARLKTLDISSCGLRPKQLYVFSKFVRQMLALGVLRLANNHITRGEKLAPDDPNVTGYHFDSSGIQQFFLTLSQNSTVRVLDISRNNLGLDGTKLFYNYVKKNRHLTELNVSGNNITNKGAILLDGLTRGPQSVMANLHLGRNHIERAGIHVLFQPPEPIPATRDLYERRSLRSISLRGNAGMDGDMLAVLVTNLRYGWHDLIRVDFSWCPLGSKGARQLAFLLRHRCIRSIQVDHCSLTDGMTSMEPMEKFASALAENETLETLNVGYNGLVGRRLGYKNDDERIIQKFVQSLQTNLSLIKLDIRGNAVGNAIRLKLQRTAMSMLKLPNPCRIAFWMCTQPRLGKNSPARQLHRGLLLYILSFCGSHRELLV